MHKKVRLALRGFVGVHHPILVLNHIDSKADPVLITCSQTFVGETIFDTITWEASKRVSPENDNSTIWINGRSDGTCDGDLLEKMFIENNRKELSVALIYNTVYKKKNRIIDVFITHVSKSKSEEGRRGIKFKFRHTAASSFDSIKV